MAQAQHGSAPSLAGLDKANPSSLIGSVAMLCEWLGIRKNLPELHAASDSIHHAIAEAVADPATRTGDLGGPLGTQAFTDVVTEKALAFLRSSK